jgi:hypothetical protein
MAMKHSFVYIGFGKCATTTLDAILRQHPQLALPCHKETLFFERKDLYDKGLEWYERRYYGKNQEKYEGKILGEINPRNSDNGNAERRILSTFGQDVKFIYMVRNPVEAVFSRFKHWLAGGGIKTQTKKYIWTEHLFDDFVSTYLDSRKRSDYDQQKMFTMHLYGRHIATALKYVPREQVYICLFEDFIRDPEQETKKILRFIGADDQIDINYYLKENSGSRMPRSEQAVKMAHKKAMFWHNYYVPYFPYAGEAIERKMDQWNWSIADKASVPATDIVRMSEETRARLKAYYLPDVELLDRTLGTNYVERWGLAE